ncbi:MAG: hypothetical protein NT062_22355 [Proteobacteria bacterium]|nr:hypothetical protein [Pseudomonadota bacterium]
MLRLAGLTMLLLATSAHAQPAQPTDPATPTDPADPNPTYQSRIGTELPKGAWPGVSLEDVRGMRACTLEDPAPVVGSPITCRPPVLPTSTHLSVDVAWLTGFAFVDGGVRGKHGLAADVEWWATRALAVGVRYELTGIGTSAMEPSGLAGTGLVTARWRGFTDEVDRDAVSVQLGAGFAMRDRDLGREPVARLAIGRDLGYMTGETGGVTWAWELAGEQGLGATKLTSVTAGVRAGFELGIREPRNLAMRDEDPPLRDALAGEFRGSPQVGLGASLDVPVPGIAIERALWRTTLLWTTAHDDDDGEHGLRGTWAALTGPRLLLLPGVFAPYVDVQAGPAAMFAPMDPDASLGVLAEAELGLDLHLGCQTTIDFAGRIQTELTDGIDVRAGFFVLRVAHGPALRRGTCRDDAPLAN